MMERYSYLPIIRISTTMKSLKNSTLINLNIQIISAKIILTRILKCSFVVVNLCFDRTLNEWEPLFHLRQACPLIWNGTFNVMKRAPTCKARVQNF